MYICGGLAFTPSATRITLILTKMKKLFHLLAVALVLGTMATTSCSPSQNGNRPAAADTVATADTVDARMAAINAYIVDSLAKNYDPADACIPCPIVTATDDSDPADIRVWGDFWVLNYKVAGDTLKNTSGGSYPGLMHLRRADDGRCTVTAFDRVADGSDFTPTAREIFGDKYDAFIKSYSDNDARQQAIADGIAAHVKAHGLSAKFYQDYGQPAKPIAAR